MASNLSYLKIGRASELSGSDRVVYRLLEILPGFLSWGTIVLVIFLSWKKPFWMAVFIIAFDVYWLIKTAYLSLHLRASWKHMQEHLAINWEKKLEGHGWHHLWQMVLLPFYNEPYEVVHEALTSLVQAEWPNERFIVVLATEERAGEGAQLIASRIREEFGEVFPHLFVTVHPDGIHGELKGKGANISWAAREATEQVVRKQGVPEEDVIVSAFDIDTLVYPQYFLCLAYHYITTENPHRSSFQPVPLYNNNIWHAPAVSRVVALSGTFWQMMQQVRPERLTTFSSHAMSLKALIEVGFWQTNMVSEDSRIFWNNFLRFNGDYTVVPLFYPVSMDANLAPTLLETSANVYRQQRRWTWGVENIPYILFGFIKNKRISLRKKIFHTFAQLEGFWSLATNPLLIFLLGWLPLVLGGTAFNSAVIAYNLPRVTRVLMSIAMTGLIGSAALAVYLMPPRPEKYHPIRSLFVILQWILIPITIIVFGAFPGLDAQTRLMFGRYMGFWVTPKVRKEIKETEVSKAM